jgi:hypothetical protein
MTLLQPSFKRKYQFYLKQQLRFEYINFKHLLACYLQCYEFICSFCITLTPTEYILHCKYNFSAKYWVCEFNNFVAVLSCFFMTCSILLFFKWQKTHLLDMKWIRVHHANDFDFVTQYKIFSVKITTNMNHADFIWTQGNILQNWKLC